MNTLDRLIDRKLLNRWMAWLAASPRWPDRSELPPPPRVADQRSVSSSARSGRLDVRPLGNAPPASGACTAFRTRSKNPCSKQGARPSLTPHVMALSRVVRSGAQARQHRRAAPEAVDRNASQWQKRGDPSCARTEATQARRSFQYGTFSKHFRMMNMLLRARRQCRRRVFSDGARFDSPKAGDADWAEAFPRRRRSCLEAISFQSVLTLATNPVLFFGGRMRV